MGGQERIWTRQEILSLIYIFFKDIMGKATNINVHTLEIC